MATAKERQPCATVLKVEPGFNTQGIEDDAFKRLTAKVSLDIFDEKTREVLQSDQEFTLVLGSGFERADVSKGFVVAPCAMLASVEQLRFLQKHGLRQIVMSRLHGTLAQNARAIGIEVIVGGT